MELNSQNLSPDRPQRVNILGVGVDPVTLTQAVSDIAAWIESRAQAYICACTVHTVMECRREEQMCRAVNRAALVVPDGMPLVWLSRAVSHWPVSRVYGPDLMLALCQLSLERSYSHYFYGGAAGVPEQLADRLQARFPGLQVAGVCSPPFRPLSPAENADIAARINQAAPDIVWVGLGTPKQDLWMAEFRPRLAAPVLVGVGAAFNFHTGLIPQAPRWMQRSGLEWLFRLSQEPGRLWYRYLVYNPWFLLLLCGQALGLKTYTLPNGDGPSHAR